MTCSYLEAFTVTAFVYTGTLCNQLNAMHMSRVGQHLVQLVPCLLWINRKSCMMQHEWSRHKLSCIPRAQYFTC